jgi:hypothetical protein
LYGIWEAKDTADDLAVEVKKKFEAGYPRDNILFQSPERAILWQHGQQILDEDISRPGDLVETLKQFFTYQPPAFEQWEQAVDEFKDRDKTQLRYNDFLTLAGIPPETFDYRLGNRSALDWIIDQYRVKTDKRSGITNDPNRLDDPQYIVRLIGQVITVSLETVAVVKGLPALE